MGESMSIGDFIKNQLVLGGRSESGTGSGTGAPGMDGMDGKTIRYGTTTPTAAVGNDGDFFINTTTSFLYGPKTNNAWPAGVSLIGPKGAKGDTGADGGIGPQGPQGPNGPNGQQGIQGPAGIGIKGDQGDAGAGVPPGGTPGQILLKSGMEDYETIWYYLPEDEAKTKPAVDMYSAVNRFVSSATKVADFSSLAASGMRLYHVPFFLRQPMSVIGLAVNVTTAGAAGTIGRAGIYEQGSNGYIGGLVATSGDMDLSTTGVKQSTFSESVMLDAGWWFLSFVSNQAVTVYAYRTVTGTLIGSNPLGFNGMTAIEYRYQGVSSMELPAAAALTTTSVNINTSSAAPVVFLVG